MRRLWQLGTRNWRTSPGRTFAALLSVALGVATVVIITSFYETARRAIREEVVNRWLGSAHLSIHPPGAHWGTIEASLVTALAEFENVRHATARLKRRMRLVRSQEQDQILESRWWWVDAIGIDPQTEQPFLHLPNLTGRMIHPDERGAAVIERETALELEVELGSPVLLSPYRGGPKMPLTIVGLFDGGRVSEFQRPSVYVAIGDVQEINNEPDAASAIDLILEDTSPSALEWTQNAVEALVAEHAGHRQHKVVSAAARQKILDEAERITRILLVLVAFIALLTSFFIILTTMSMSLFERRRLLGVMRCVGLTRGQLAALLFIELTPLGVAGTLGGVLLGIGVAKSASHWPPHARLDIYLSSWGIALATASGLVTTLLSSTILLLQIGRVAPLSAVNPQAAAPKTRLLYISGLLGVLLLLVHEGIMHTADQTLWLSAVFTSAGVATLYLGYVLLVPIFVVLLGRPLARLVGPMLGLRQELTEDQFGRAPWRSTGVCWVLMVGLSLIVYIGIGSEAVLAVWDFPGRLPEAFVWSRNYAPGSAIDHVRQLPGVHDVITVTDVDCEITTPDAAPVSKTDALMKRFWRKFTRPVFVAAELDKLLQVFKLTFIEGDLSEAQGKIARGGYVLIPVQTSQNKRLHLGDHVTVTVQDRSADFEIAGVVQSPALDLAVTAFQAESYMQFAAASVLIGSRQDLKDKFGLDVVSLILCNIDVPPVPVPADFTRDELPDSTDERSIARALLRWCDHLPSERDRLTQLAPRLEDWLQTDPPTPLPTDMEADLKRFGRVFRHIRSRWARRSPDESWYTFRMGLVVLKIAHEIERPDAFVGSMTMVKQQLDRHIRQATVLLTWLPSLLLPVVAIGIGNLMMVSVQIRARQIAVLRAVGAIRSQIIRLVLAEAITLGLLGSLAGLSLGLHEAYSDNRISGALIGFYPEFIIPIGTVALGVLLTIATCLLAGVAPARWAARSNVIAAMQTT